MAKEKEKKELIDEQKIRRSILELKTNLIDSRRKTDEIYGNFDEMSRKIKSQVEDLKETVDNLPL